MGTLVFSYMDIRILQQRANFVGIVDRCAAGACVATAAPTFCHRIDMDKPGTKTDTDGTLFIAAFNEGDPADAAADGIQMSDTGTGLFQRHAEPLLRGKVHVNMGNAVLRQLQVVGEQVHVPVFEKGTQDPVKTAKEAIEYARYYQRDVLIIDTAGRLHIDEALMDELLRIKQAVHPQEILLTVDAMTGQDAVNVAKTFDEKLDVTGVILTKLDGDTRGGAALSVKAVTGKPIKFSGIGEKLTDIEPFYPDRMASRILGMGDVLTLIDKASEAFDEQDAEKFARKGLSNKLTLEDFLDQMQSMKKMGGLKSMLNMLPGMSGKDIEVDDNALKKPEAIICSMTMKERKNPGILNASRRKRIAAGAGVQVQDVNALIRQFEQMQKMMKQMMGNKKAMMRSMRNMNIR